MEAVAAPVYACDAEGRVIFFNDAAAALWGRRPELGKDLWCGSWRIFTPDGADLPLDRCPMAVALKEGRGVRGTEIVVERPDGSRRRVLPHPEPLRDGTGRITGAVNLLIDVTEQREAERAQALLAAIVASSDDAIISKTLDGHITSWNAGATRIFGYTAEEAVGRHITMLIPEARLAEEDEILARLRRGQRIEHFETVRRAKDGRLLDISLTVSPVRDRAGRLIGASKVARDITEQKRVIAERATAERALAESEARLRTILSLLPVGVYACDAEGRIIFHNRAAVELWGQEPNLGTARYCGAARVFWPDGAPVPPDRIPMVIAIEEGTSFRGVEAVFQRIDGTRFPVSVTIDPVRDASGRVVGAINVFQDVSVQVAAREALQNQQRRLEEAVAKRSAELEASHRRLRQSERMAVLGTLSAGLGHDMGNLLLPVRVSLEILESVPLPQAAATEVGRIRTSVEYLQQLANGLRMMALDPEKPAIAEPLQVKAWWTDAEPIIRNALPRGIVLESDVDEDAWITISRPALAQTIFNLAQNAGDVLRGRPGGRVRLTARRDGDRVLLCFEDNGPGMTEEVKQRCLEPFYTTKTRSISTGLGLVLVAGNVREAGGTLQIESEPGLGTTFRISLPVAEPPAQPRAGRAGHAALDVRDPRLRSFVAAELRRLGYEVGVNGHRSYDIAVVDGRGALQPGTVRARHVVLLAAGDGHPPSVTALGENPKPEKIRGALTAALAADGPNETAGE